MPPSGMLMMGTAVHRPMGYGASTFGGGPAAPGGPGGDGTDLFSRLFGGAGGSTSRTTPRVYGGGGYGSGPAAAAGGPPGGGAPPDFTSSTAAPNPFQTQALDRIRSMEGAGDPGLQEAVQAWRDRMSADTTGRAIARAGSASDESLAGAVQRAKEAAARSGGGPGEVASAAGALEQANQRNKAGQAADISLGREKSLDQLALGGAGILAAPGERAMRLASMELGGAGDIASQQGQGLDRALRAWQASQGFGIDRARLAQDAASRQQDTMMRLYSML